MNDLSTAKASFAEQSVIFTRTQNWIMCWLYTGTFGSFIGFSAAFPLLTSTQFPEVNVLQIAFLGPLVGALSRSLTGWVSDRFGGARVTLAVFVLMMLGTIGVHLLPRQQGRARRVHGLLRLLHAALLRERRRQRIHLPNDPGDHAEGDRAACAATLPPRRS